MRFRAAAICVEKALDMCNLVYLMCFLVAVARCTLASLQVQEPSAGCRGATTAEDIQQQITAQDGSKTSIALCLDSISQRCDCHPQWPPVRTCVCRNTSSPESEQLQQGPFNVHVTYQSTEKSTFLQESQRLARTPECSKDVGFSAACVAASCRTMVAGVHRIQA